MVEKMEHKEKNNVEACVTRSHHEVLYDTGAHISKDSIINTARFAPWKSETFTKSQS